MANTSPDILAAAYGSGYTDGASDVESLINALEFYADPRRYQGANQSPIPNDPFSKPDASYIQDVTRDNGELARGVLVRIGTTLSSTDRTPGAK